MMPRETLQLIISCCIWNMWWECMVQFLHSLWAVIVWCNLTRLADVAMVVLHLTKCTQLMQQWIRIALSLCPTVELFRKSNFVTFSKVCRHNNNLAMKKRDNSCVTICMFSSTLYHWRKKRTAETDEILKQGRCDVNALRGNSVVLLPTL